jgi:hypothetical protein
MYKDVITLDIKGLQASDIISVKAEVSVLALGLMPVM